jgi:SAM-dependent methyltransferase
MDEQTARWYVENYGEHISQSMTVDIAGISAGDAVLDIGCGSGHAVRLAAGLTGGTRVIGIDPSLAMVRIARQLTASHPAQDRIVFRIGSAESMPVEAASLTLALAINSVHHWYDLDRGLAEAKRVLAPGGRLIISEERLAGGRFGHGQGEATEPEYVAQAMRAAGFRHVRVETHVRESDAILYVLGAKPEVQSPWRSSD